MGSLRDLTGYKFGRLTVVCRAENIEKRTRWQCKCTCGKVLDIDAYSLYKGLTNSCGCLAAQKTSIRRASDITGETYGRLKAVRSVGVLKGKTMWECICSCGKTTTTTYGNIVFGKAQSCGCIKKESAAKNGKAGSKKISGAKSHLYKSSLTEEDRLRVRNCTELRDWRKAVFVRDNYTCRICGQKGVKLEAHHLEDWASNKALRYSVSNGVTLCQKEHREFHRLIGLRNGCTKSQYINFEIERLRRNAA